MKILQLTAENVKRLKVVNITPEPGLNQVTGKNGHGKSSVLDSIWWAVGGKKQIQAVPVRKGCESARVRLDLGELIVERTFTAAGTTTITVRNPVGAAKGTPDKKLPAFQSPQDILDALVGSLSFDPLAFANKRAREQYDELKPLVNLDVDIEALELANEQDFKRRTEANRDLKSKQAQAEGVTYAENLPEARVDERALLTSMEEAAAFNAQLEGRKGRREQAERSVLSARRDAENLRQLSSTEHEKAEKQIADLERELEEFKRIAFADADEFQRRAVQADNTADSLAAKLASAELLPDPFDIAELRAKVDEARIINRELGYRDQKNALLDEVKALHQYSQEMTQKMESREKTKAAALAKAVMPVEGLSLAAGAVLLNGLPFDQASDAERLRVSVAIAMAANPTLRVIRIKDGSLLDDEGIEMLAQMATERDYQVWLERVDNSGEIGIVMEDGAVKKKPEPVAEGK